MKQAIALVVFLLVTVAVAVFGAQFEPGEWYRQLVKPTWTPPDAIFAPVWTVLYVMIALAGWAVWRAGDRGPALALWSVALVLNGLWSWLFFGQHAIGLALVDIVALWLTLIAFALVAWPRSRAASLLFVPYIVWVGYAALLNAAIWTAN